MLSLAGVAAICRRLPDVPRVGFDRGPLRQLRSMRPEFVFLGNSMVQSRISVPVLNKALAPRRAMSLATGGSMSALWYTQIANYLVPSEHRPTRLLVFFRNAELTRPRDQITGDQWANIQRASPEDSPVVAAKLVPPWREPRERLHYLLWRAFPTARLRRISEVPTEQAIAWVSSALGPAVTPRERRKLINSPFSGPSWAREGGAPPDPTNLDLRPIEQVADESLLPDILGLVREHRIPTTFVRVRTAQRAVGTPEPKELTQYIAGLRRYIEQHGALFVDMSNAEWESYDLYGSGDHIAGRALNNYSRQLVRREPELFR